MENVNPVLLLAPRPLNSLPGYVQVLSRMIPNR